MSLETQLSEGLAALELGLDAEVRRKLLGHVALVNKWNRVHNLTAVREPEQMVGLHVLDSLSLLPHLQGARRLIDVGTGAGFPGLPIAIAMPGVQVTVLDSSHKKCSFLEQARAELGLTNVAVACERVEQYSPPTLFDTVVSRAFAELQDFVTQAKHLAEPGGRFLAMKGVYPFEEIARVPQSHRVARVVELNVPSVDAKRHLVLLEAA
jgi:16S rRNA (guanine527-N7)-methyltransferase